MHIQEAISYCLGKARVPKLIGLVEPKSLYFSTCALNRALLFIYFFFYQRNFKMNNLPITGREI